MPPMGSSTHSSHLLWSAGRAVTGLTFLQTLLITAGGCFCFSAVPGDILWGRGEEARGVGWLGVHMDTADELHFSFLTPTPQTPPSVVLHQSSHDVIQYSPVLGERKSTE